MLWCTAKRTAPRAESTGPYGMRQAEPPVVTHLGHSAHQAACGIGTVAYPVAEAAAAPRLHPWIFRRLMDCGPALVVPNVLTGSGLLDLEALDALRPPAPLGTTFESYTPHVHALQAIARSVHATLFSPQCDVGGNSMRQEVRGPHVSPASCTMAAGTQAEAEPGASGGTTCGTGAGTSITGAGAVGAVDANASVGGAGAGPDVAAGVCAGAGPGHSGAEAAASPRDAEPTVGTEGGAALAVGRGTAALPPVDCHGSTRLAYRAFLQNHRDLFRRCVHAALLPSVLELHGGGDPAAAHAAFLVLSTVLERALGDAFHRDCGGTKPVPHLLKDVLSSPEAQRAVGCPLLHWIRVLMGPAYSLNLRNLLWHGFLGAAEFDPAYTTFLVLVLCTFLASQPDPSAAPSSGRPPSPLPKGLDGASAAAPPPGVRSPAAASVARAAMAPGGPARGCASSVPCSPRARSSTARGGVGGAPPSPPDPTAPSPGPGRDVSPEPPEAVPPPGPRGFRATVDLRGTAIGVGRGMLSRLAPHGPAPAAASGPGPGAAATPSSATAPPEEVLALASGSVLLTRGQQAQLRQAYAYYRRGQRTLSCCLLLPLLEHALRCPFVVANGLPAWRLQGRWATAFCTLDHILGCWLEVPAEWPVGDEAGVEDGADAGRERGGGGGAGACDGAVPDPGPGPPEGAGAVPGTGNENGVGAVGRGSGPCGADGGPRTGAGSPPQTRHVPIGRPSASGPGPVQLNALRRELGDGVVDCLLDLFHNPRGPRLRDRVAHGEVLDEHLDGGLVEDLVAVLLFLCRRYTPPEAPRQPAAVCISGAVTGISASRGLGNGRDIGTGTDGATGPTADAVMGAGPCPGTGTGTPTDIGADTGTSPGTGTDASTGTGVGMGACTRDAPAVCTGTSEGHGAGGAAWETAAVDAGVSTPVGASTDAPAAATACAAQVPDATAPQPHGAACLLCGPFVRYVPLYHPRALLLKALVGALAPWVALRDLVFGPSASQGRLWAPDGGPLEPEPGLGRLPRALDEVPRVFVLPVSPWLQPPYASAEWTQYRCAFSAVEYTYSRDLGPPRTDEGTGTGTGAGARAGAGSGTGTGIGPGTDARTGDAPGPPGPDADAVSTAVWQCLAMFGDRAVQKELPALLGPPAKPKALPCECVRSVVAVMLLAAVVEGGGQPLPHAPEPVGGATRPPFVGTDTDTRTGPGPGTNTGTGTGMCTGTGTGTGTGGAGGTSPVPSIDPLVSPGPASSVSSTARPGAAPAPGFRYVPLTAAAEAPDLQLPHLHSVWAAHGVADTDHGLPASTRPYLFSLMELDRQMLVAVAAAADTALAHQRHLLGLVRGRAATTAQRKAYGAGLQALPVLVWAVRFLVLLAERDAHAWAAAVRDDAAYRAALRAVQARLAVAERLRGHLAEGKVGRAIHEVLRFACAAPNLRVIRHVRLRCPA